MYWKPENVICKDGSLQLKSVKVASNKMNCGAINSNKLYQLKYGYVEVRMEVAQTLFGSHTSFWAQSNTMEQIDGTGKDGELKTRYNSKWIPLR